MNKQIRYQGSQSRYHLLSMLICFTLMFVLTQGFLFYVHYSVTDILDAFVHSSLSFSSFHANVFVPMAIFIVIQLAAYAWFVGWIWFISVSAGQLLKLTEKMVYLLGLSDWVLACLALLGLNHHYYPHSFFSMLPNNWNCMQPYINAITIFSLVVLVGVSIVACVNVLMHTRYRLLCMVLLLPGCMMVGMQLYDKVNVQKQMVQVHDKPNIIFIGLDSLRPDFTGYFTKNRKDTPSIDDFLSSATTFTQTYSPLARTFPAWISVLTAKYPKHSGARNNLADPKALLTEDTLAKQLQQNGYETIYATDEKRFSNITSGYGFDRVLGPGMGVNDFLLGGLGDFPLTNLLVNLPMGKYLFPYNYANRAAAITYDPANFLQLVRSGLSDRSDKPLFLAVHLCLSHWPFTWASDHQSDRDAFAEKYRTGVRGVDTQLSQLMRMLRDDGLLEHSIVVLLSDHGTTLGLPADRVTNKNHYVGDIAKLKLINVSKYSAKPEFSLNFKDDYGVDTSYGQGTDVLSLKQNHVLLAFKGYGVHVPIQQVKNMSSLLDITPTILDLLNLPAMKSVDGVSLQPYFSQKKWSKTPSRMLFIETGDSLSEIETDHIYVEKVIKHEIGVYRMNPDNGLLFMDNQAEKSVLINKQFAVMSGDWLLARYPAQNRTKLVVGDDAKDKSALRLKNYVIPPYYVLVNLRTRQWTVGLSSPFAKSAPIQELMRRLKAFYGNDLA